MVVNIRHPDGIVEPLAIGIPGDRDVDEKRLQAQLEPAVLEPFDESDFAKHPTPRQGLHRATAVGQ